MHIGQSDAHSQNCLLKNHSKNILNDEKHLWNKTSLSNMNTVLLMNHNSGSYSRDNEEAGITHEIMQPKNRLGFPR